MKEQKKQDVNKELDSLFSSADFFNKLESSMPDSQKVKLTGKVIDTLFSKDSYNILQTSDFTKREIYGWVAELEILFTFLVNDFIFDEQKRNHLIDLKNRLYLMTSSTDRKGRIELYDSLKVELNHINLEELQKQRLLSK